MEKRILLSIIALSMVALAVAILLPGGRPPDSDPALPWKISVGPNGRTSVLGLELGTSALADAQTRFAESGSTNLFIAPEGSLSIETFFDKIYLSGLKADIVLTLAVPPEQAQQMLSRGIRSAGLGDGSKKITPSPEDIERLPTCPRQTSNPICSSACSDLRVGESKSLQRKSPIGCTLSSGWMSSSTFKAPRCFNTSIRERSLSSWSLSRSSNQDPGLACHKTNSIALAGLFLLLGVLDVFFAAVSVRVIVVIHQNSVRITLQIVELTGARSPEKNPDRNDAEQNHTWDQPVDYVHFPVSMRSNPRPGSTPF